MPHIIVRCKGGTAISDAPEKILELWIDHVNKLEVQKVIDLYDEKSVLLPTFSPHCMAEPRQIREYFTQLFARKGLMAKLHRGTLRKTSIGEDRYILTGIYSFQFAVDDSTLTFPSRFTLVLDLSNEKPIIHHHSSQVPRTLS